MCTCVYCRYERSDQESRPAVEKGSSADELYRELSGPRQIGELNRLYGVEPKG